MLNSSTSDFINIIGSSEVESFNKTLNEMWMIWNTEPSASPQQAMQSPLTTQQQLQLQQQILQQQTSQLESNINLILNGVNSNNNSNNNNSGQNSSGKNGRAFLTSSNSGGLDTYIFGEQQPQPFQQSGDTIGKMNKVINEINSESKAFQPIEIVPLKSLQQQKPTENIINTQPQINNLNEINLSFGGLSSFNIENSKLEELKSDLSFLDPILSVPYNNSNNNISWNSILNNKQQQLNNNNNNESIKQENNTTFTGPIRHDNYFDQASKEKESSSPAPPNTIVTLNNEQLNSFSSMEMEEYATMNKNLRDLTPQEKRDLKRQKRLIKNRESAHLSRQRKRERLTELEHRVEELSHNSVEISKNLTGLQSENLVLKAEVNQLLDVINDSPVLSAIFCAMNGNQQLQQLQQKQFVGAY